ncbi:uncharacterized protein LOC144373238 isoform X10 [Ictidomys tridecemlineatus]
MAAGAGARARARLCVRAPPECSPRAWRPRLCPGARPARGGRAWSRRVEWRHRWMCCPGQHLWSMLMMKNIRKWRQREIMKPVQDYNTASLLQEMCRRRSHVPQKADFSLVKDCQSWRGKATVSFTSHSRLPQMFANSFRGR